MFTWTDFEYYENQLMDELLTTALEWGDYQLAIEILENSKGTGTSKKECTDKSLFTKLHLLGIIYDRQQLTGLAEKMYNRALKYLLEDDSFDPIEVSLFLKNYAACLKQLDRHDVAVGLEIIAETLRYASFANFKSIFENQALDTTRLSVANVA